MHTLKGVAVVKSAAHSTGNNFGLSVLSKDTTTDCNYNLLYLHSNNGPSFVKWQ